MKTEVHIKKCECEFSVVNFRSGFRCTSCQQLLTFIVVVLTSFVGSLLSWTLQQNSSILFELITNNFQTFRERCKIFNGEINAVSKLSIVRYAWLIWLRRRSSIFAVHMGVEHIWHCSPALHQLDVDCIGQVLTPLLKMNTDAIVKLAAEIQSH